jgi:flagellar motor protein MotB
VRKAPERLRLAPARKHGGIAEDANAHLWAISYSDLIMVLLCFFIVFFRFNDKVELRAVDKIKMALTDQKAGSETPVGNGGAGEGTASGDTQKELAAKLLHRIAGVDVKQMVTAEGDVLMLDFPPEAYGPGGFKVEDGVKKGLDDVLKVLKPFGGVIHVSFIGHADDTPITQTHKGVVDSNLVLSNLRGAKAMEYAVKRGGFDPARLTAGGAGEYSRNTRSLTLKVTVDK